MYDKKNFYWSPAFRICMGCLPKYERNLLKIGFENTYFQVFKGFPALKKRLLHTSSQMANFGQFLAKMGKTEIFFKKAIGTFFSLLKALINCKVSENSNEGIPRKMRKPSIFGHFGPKWPILDSFWPKWAKREFFSKKRLEHFSRTYKP